MGWVDERINKDFPLKMVWDRVLVKREDAESKTSGGIFIPDTAKEKPMKGKVIQIGFGRYNDSGKLIPICVSVGTTVLFSKYTGTEINYEGVDYLILSESDILAAEEKGGAG